MGDFGAKNIIYYSWNFNIVSLYNGKDKTTTKENQQINKEKKS